jgi:hypothetical protein
MEISRGMSASKGRESSQARAGGFCAFALLQDCQTFWRNTVIRGTQSETFQRPTTFNLIVWAWFQLKSGLWRGVVASAT